ncbi:hypothetical protein J6590_096469, partial [Homalodisca vitripennis]
MGVTDINGANGMGDEGSLTAGGALSVLVEGEILGSRHRHANDTKLHEKVSLAVFFNRRLGRGLLTCMKNLMCHKLLVAISDLWLRYGENGVQELKTASRDRMCSAHTRKLRCTWDYTESKIHSHIVLSVLLCKLNLNQTVPGLFSTPVEFSSFDRNTKPTTTTPTDWFDRKRLGPTRHHDCKGFRKEL